MLCYTRWTPLNKKVGQVMYVDEDEVKETIEMMNNGEISVAEAWEILDWFDGDLIEFL